MVKFWGASLCCDCRRLGTTKSELKIYDPFFCEGRMVQHLNKLGFSSVYNK
jgi:hypothetical protein